MHSFIYINIYLSQNQRMRIESDCETAKDAAADDAGIQQVRNSRSPQQQQQQQVVQQLQQHLSQSQSTAAARSGTQIVSGCNWMNYVCSLPIATAKSCHTNAPVENNYGKKKLREGYKNCHRAKPMTLNCQTFQKICWNQIIITIKIKTGWPKSHTNRLAIVNFA